jgi:poly-gamma-glutamate capsule biosynthesis protein CapA/YwtB (metallophosphatase superfamily)
MKKAACVGALWLLGCAGDAQRFEEQPIEVVAAAAARDGGAAASPAAAPPVVAGDADVITLSAVGDLALGDLHYGAGAPGSFAAELAEKDDPMGYPFSAVKHVFEKDDLTIGNLECTFSERKAWSNPVFSIRGVPENAQMLPRASVEVVDVYNNHSFDYGAEGHEDTKRALAAVKVGFFGKDVVERRTIKGMKIVMLGYLGGPEGTKKQMLADIAREKGEKTIIIVSFHWGVEAFYATHPDQIALGHAAIDAGAELVLGHHPHVLQGIETYKGRHIVYSLGNFVFGANSQPKDMDSIIYQERFHLKDGAVASVDNGMLPVRISSIEGRNDFKPVLLEGDEAARVIAKVDKLSKALVKD